jgi:hypothetical protein
MPLVEAGMQAGCAWAPSGPTFRVDAVTGIVTAEAAVRRYPSEDRGLPAWHGCC